MIDFHNHILPNVDDGSKSIEMSLNMLKTAQEYGTTDVINTVHFQHPKMEFIDTSYDFIISKTEKLQSSVYKNDINIKIHTGSEVFFNYNLIDILDNPITTIGNGKYMLIEFQTYQFPKDYDQVLYDLAIHGVTPIIAHPERYREIQNEVEIIKKLVDSGCLIQLDAGSVLGHFGEKCMEISFEMLKRSMVHFIGSDAHNDKKRSFCLGNTINILKKEHFKNLDIIIYDNPRKLLNGHNIEPFDIFIKKKKNNFWGNLFNPLK